jgi:hypothetical protein
VRASKEEETKGKAVDGEGKSEGKSRTKKQLKINMLEK